MRRNVILQEQKETIAKNKGILWIGASLLSFCSLIILCYAIVNGKVSPELLLLILLFQIPLVFLVRDVRIRRRIYRQLDAVEDVRTETVTIVFRKMKAVTYQTGKYRSVPRALRLYDAEGREYVYVYSQIPWGEDSSVYKRLSTRIGRTMVLRVYRGTTVIQSFSDREILDKNAYTSQFKR